MSGIRETTVRVPQQEINQLRDQARRADDLESKNRILDKQKKERERRVQELDHVIRMQDERAERYERRLNSFNQELGELEKKTHKQFQEHRKEFINQLHDAVEKQQAYTDRQIRDVHKRIDQETGVLRDEMKEQRKEYQQLLEQQHQYFDQAIQQQGKILEDHINHLESSIQNRLQNQASVADEWLKALEDEIDFIKKNYRFVQFASGELDEIEKSLNLVVQDIKQEMFEAATVSGRNGYIEARKLRHKLELMEAEWEHFYQLASEYVTGALILIDEYQNYALKMDAFENQEIQLNTDYWTDGKWSDLRLRIAKLQDDLGKKKQGLRISDLQEIIRASECSMEELIDLDTTAKSRLFASIKRKDIQEQIYEKLTDYGYHLVESTYEGEDFRNAYFMKMRNGNNEEIITIVSPEENEFSNRLSFNFYDKSPNEAIREERTREIGRFLEKENLNIGKAQCLPQYEHHNAPEEIRDFEKIRKAGQAQMPKSVI